ncbi:SDR family NAD(P)-dependent oxidoreductase [Natrononativus amylolyticus]|uniref:SDR family NAD(P)-dependent oxidoreductase n=1 Tax=Natrononativus amylolyticus TaxID=2963434 RepID=UPI0020CD6C2D|nr:SDR family oxidoreductase [Natrononativus amylolyticus]
MTEDASPRALITGGSRGIGRALAAAFAADGYDLVLVARNEERLEAVARELECGYGVDVTTVSADLTDPDALEEVYERATAGGAVDVLVNNAAVAVYGPVAETDLEAERDQVRLNVAAPVELTKRFLPAMLERDSGHVVTVASTAGMRPGPFLAGYHASKAYLISFSEGLTEELRGTGVDATVVCPGPVLTGIHERSGRGSRWLERRFMRSPDAVAADSYEGIRAGKAVVVPGLRFRLLPWVSRLLPRPLSRRLARLIIDRGDPLESDR